MPRLVTTRNNQARIPSALLGGTSAVAELQARWVTAVWAGKLPVPSDQEIEVCHLFGLILP